MSTTTGVGQNNIDDLYLEKIKCEKPVSVVETCSTQKILLAEAVGQNNTF